MCKIVGHTTRILRNRQLLRGTILGKGKGRRGLGSGTIGMRAGPRHWLAAVGRTSRSSCRKTYRRLKIVAAAIRMSAQREGHPILECFKTTGGAVSIVDLIAVSANHLHGFGRFMALGHFR